MDTIFTTSTDVVNYVSYSSIYRFVNLFVLMGMDTEAPDLQAILLCFKFNFVYDISFLQYIAFYYPFPIIYALEILPESVCLET